MFGQALVFFNDLLRNLVEIIWHFIKRHNDRMYLWIIAIARVTDNAALHTHKDVSTTLYYCVHKGANNWNEQTKQKILNPCLSIY